MITVEQAVVLFLAVFGVVFIGGLLLMYRIEDWLEKRRGHDNLND